MYNYKLVSVKSQCNACQSYKFNLIFQNDYLLHDQILSNTFFIIHTFVFNIRIIESNQHSPFYRSRFRVQLRINVRKGEIFHHFHDRLYSNENTWHGALEERYEALVWRGGEEERGPIQRRVRHTHSDFNLVSMATRKEEEE